MEPVTGLPNQEPAVVAPATQGQPVPEPNTALSEFKAEPAAPATPVQGQPEPPKPTPQEHYQSLFNQEQARRFQAEQQLQALQQQAMQLLQNQQPQTAQNPFDPQTNFGQWLDFQQDQRDKRLLTQVNQGFQEQLSGLLTRATALQQEQSFLQKHPEANLQLVKSWMQMNGVSNPEHAWTLMNFPQVMQNAVQTAFTQTPQTPNQAAPLRGTQTPQSGVPGYSYARMLEAYIKDPNVFDTWPLEAREGFKKESLAREAQGN